MIHGSKVRLVSWVSTLVAEKKMGDFNFAENTDKMLETKRGAEPLFIRQTHKNTHEHERTPCQGP